MFGVWVWAGAEGRRRRSFGAEVGSRTGQVVVLMFGVVLLFGKCGAVWRVLMVVGLVRVWLLWVGREVRMGGSGMLLGR